MFAHRLLGIGLFVTLVASSACSSDDSGGAPVISKVDIPGQAKKAADGKYEAILMITASDDGTIKSARIDFSSDEPARIVGTEVPINAQKLDAKAVTFRIDASAGPGSGDANLVLTDDSGNVTKKKILVTMVD